MQGLTIVRGGAGRLDQLEPLWISLSEHHAELTPPDLPTRGVEEGWKVRRERYRVALEEGALLLIAETDAGPVGFALARPKPAPANLEIDRLLEVETVAVLPEARGQGIGSALMDAIDDWAAEEGIDHLQVAVRSRNVDARRLYERRGFGALYVTMLSTPARRVPVELHPTVEPDLDLVLAWESDADAAPFVTGWSRERHRQAIEEKDEAHLVITRNGEPLGFVLLAGLADEDGNIELRRIVVARKGEGIGRDALRLVLEEAFERYRARRIWLDVLPENVRARTVYEAVGFVEESPARQSLWTDGDESLVVMSLPADRWRKKVVPSHPH